jgi:HAD superfamily hydrolase (TIGR01484 family)
MKPLTELAKKDIKDIKLVCFDVDGVTIKKGTDIKEVKTKENTTLTVKTNNLSERVRDKMLELKKHFVIAVSSGRSSMYLTKVYHELLWGNTALISENGIFTLMNGELIQNEKFDERTLNKMRNIVVDLKKLEGKHKDFRAFEPKQLLITLHAWNEILEVYDIVKKHDPEGEFYTWWNGEAFDIAPKRLNKGTGLKHLANHLKMDLKETMAIGNGPNDKDMIDIAGIGVTTEPKVLPADYHTTEDEHLGGEELVDKLLELKK